MTRPDSDAPVRLDLNNPKFQQHLFALQKSEQQAVLKTLNKFRQLTWGQVYGDTGLKWEKIASVTPPAGITAVYWFFAIRGGL
jgi:hypothetical protein